MIFEVRPAVVGHRGFGSGSRGGHRENSIGSFLAAAQGGATWVELDVRRSSDGELVVWHDPRTPAGRPVLERTAGELATEGIHSLTEVLAALPAGLGVDMDVKITVEDATEQADRRTHALVAEAVRAAAGTRPLLVSSFDPSVPVYLAGRAELAGQVGLGLLTSQHLSPELGVVAAANLGLGVALPYVGTLALDGDGGAAAAAVIEMAHQAGLEVMTWTATPAQAVTAVAAGIDGVCVDDVPGTVAALAAARA
ncbi:MAG: glycerophosphodiester phosphodiesterase [Actinobacteria bacterium]|nr:glycerophosphodiester phosphodiesterase [Actinomycetota bacterium]